jgi:adapter protein MecA 1/2
MYIIVINNMISDLDVVIMRIEKLNDNQIRCTLTRDDLATRQIKLSELAYGTEKAKELFRDMMQQASVDFGFEADNIPLMIEAIPLPNECIVLIITKVEDPEELDTRFSKFAPGSDNRFEDVSELGSVLPEGADNVLDMFRKLIERHLKEGTQEEQEEKAIALAQELDLTRLYFFSSLDLIISAAHVLENCYSGCNTLFRLKKDGSYCLVARKSSHTPEEFNKISNILSEYGSSEKYATASEAYLEEHEELMIRDEALQKLALL